MRYPRRTIALAAAAVVLLTGCSTSHAFRLLLTVTNADDGTPVQGATVVLDTSQSEARMHDLAHGSQIGPTDAAGKLTHDFSFGGYTKRTGPWYLKVQKEGFEPRVIDISPRTDAKSGEPNPLPVAVELKPLAKKP